MKLSEYDPAVGIRALLLDKTDAENRIYVNKVPLQDPLTGAEPIHPWVLVRVAGGARRIRAFFLIQESSQINSPHDALFKLWGQINELLDNKSPNIGDIPTGYCTIEDGSPYPSEDKATSNPEIVAQYTIEVVG